MTEKQYKDKFDHDERECSHDWKTEIYCDCLGLSVTEEDMRELGYCPVCFGNEDNLFHECKFCGDRLSHIRFINLERGFV